MYRFDIKRYFLFEDDLSIMVNAARRRDNISRLDLSKIFDVPLSTIKDNEYHCQNESLLDSMKVFFNVNSFSDFTIINEIEDYLNNIYAAVVYARPALVNTLIAELEEKYRCYCTNNLLGVLLDLIILIGYGSFNLEMDEEKNKQVCTKQLEKLQWYIDDLLSDHQFFIYCYMAYLASKNRNHELAIKYVEKAKLLCHVKQRPLMCYQFTVIYQFACEFSHALFYAQEGIKLFNTSNNLERSMQIQSNIAWSFVKLKNFAEARKILEPFISIGMENRNMKFKTFTLTNYAYLLFFEYEYQRAYECFNELLYTNRYEDKAMIYLISLKLNLPCDYQKEISNAYVTRGCWSGYYLATIYFQNIYKPNSDYLANVKLFDELMSVFKNNSFTNIYDVIIKESALYNAYHKHNQFLELQSDIDRLKEAEELVKTT